MSRDNVMVGTHERRVIASRLRYKGKEMVGIELHRLAVPAHTPEPGEQHYPQYGVFFIELTEEEAEEFARDLADMMGVQARAAVAAISGD